ncbi:MAG: AAA family ATPase [Chthoniobacteraceae bacterium]|nr:AAA family ATPase [Chthoniobacteraceae bacterium]
MSTTTSVSSVTAPEAQKPHILTRIKDAREAVVRELRKVVVGQDEPIDQVLIGMFAGGHLMIQGPPGTAKTLIIVSIAKVMALDFKRIQFTPDLMPSDISGTEILEADPETGRRVTKFVKGPVFCNLVMADEINRTPPKTQAALLEVMQERQVTISGKTHALPKPFYVMATQISMEQEGTYPLPEAQQDRFMLSVMMDYLPDDEEAAVVRESTGPRKVILDKVIDGAQLAEFTGAIRAVALPRPLGQFIVDLTSATRPTVAGCPDFVKEYVAWGAGLRASQNLALASKSAAALEGRGTVTFADIRKVIAPVLRHRIGLSFRAEVDRVTIEDLIGRIIATIPQPKED